MPANVEYRLGLFGNPNSSFVIKTNSETLDKLSKFTCDI